MKKLVYLFLCLCLHHVGRPQDYIFLKDKSVQKAKILEVSLDKVKFKKYEIIDGPTYEILKSDVIKIRYFNGFTDVFDKGYPVDSISKVSVHDTSSYSIIYIVNTYDQSAKLTFPVYINGKLVMTIKNHGRGVVKLFSEGRVLLERQPKERTSPRVELLTRHGKNYGIRIEHSSPKHPLSNKRFSLEVVSDSADVKSFLVNEFYSKGNGPPIIFFNEDFNNPIIEF